MVGGYHEIFTSTACYRISRCSCRKTVINYDDGSTYTLTDGQEIYISSQTLFKRRILNNKDTIFTAQDPWTSRDYVPEPQDF